MAQHLPEWPYLAWDHTAQDRLCNFAFADAETGKQGPENHLVFIRGLEQIGLYPPDFQPLILISHPKDDVGIADIYCKYHSIVFYVDKNKF
jgi:hypothetical protein